MFSFKSTLSNYKPILICIVIVAGASMIGRQYASAENPPPRIVIDSMNNIMENQKTITVERPHVERFNAAKTDNNVMVGRMQANCYDFDWQKMKPFKMKDCLYDIAPL